MGLIEAVYITDDRDNLVFQYLSSLSTPSLKYIQSKIDQFKQRQDESWENGYRQIDQCSSADPIIEIDKRNVATCYKHQSLWFYVIGAQDEVIKYEDVSSVSSSDEEESSEDDSEEDDSEGGEEEKEEEEADSENDKEEIEESEKDKEIINSKPNPLICIEFIKQFINVLETYVSNPISIQKLTNKYEVVNMLLQNMIDFQFPFITDLNQLKELTPRDSILSKIMNQTRKISTNATSSITRNSSSSSINSSSSLQNGVNGGIVAPNTKKLGILESNNKIPWRKSNVKYSNNEMFVDLIETINVIFPPQRPSLKSGDEQMYSSAFYNPNFNYKPIKPIVATINGLINFTSYLSGIPDLEMVLDVGRHDLQMPSFHPSVRINKWEKTHNTLSFIPADGKFKLMEYEIDLLNNDKYSDHLNEILTYLGIIEISFQTGLGSMQNEFEIKLNLQILKMVKSAENLQIEIYTNDDDLIKTLKLTHGDLLKSSSNKYIWMFDKSMTCGISPMLHGVITNSMSAEHSDKVSSIAPTSKYKKAKSPIFIKLNYSNKNSLPSGLKISSLQILSAKGMGENVKPYKGVKYMTKTGDYILR